VDSSDPFEEYDPVNVYPPDLSDMGEDIYKKVKPAIKEKEELQPTGDPESPHVDFKPYGTKRTYPQNWPAYNSVKQKEGSLIKNTLFELLSYTDFANTYTLGRRPIPLRNKIFFVVMQAYYNKSRRTCVDLLKACKEKGFIGKTPHFNSLGNALTDPGLTPYLKHLINISGYPLKQCETDFAMDSSGISTGMYERWFDIRTGYNSSRRKFVKVHLIVGTLTNIIAGVEITPGYAADSPQVSSLLKQAGRIYSPKRVSADKAYSSRKNLAEIHSYGAIPFIPFKLLASPRPMGDWIWRKMFDLYWHHPAQFKLRYHQRSNVEANFQMLKTKFGTHVRSRQIVPQTNELLARCLAHNLCVLVQEAAELEIDLDFRKCADFKVAQK